MKKAEERQLPSDKALPEGLCHVVGIGASAGGLESLQQLFGHIAPGGRLSFVVIQHLSPSHRSMMADILSHHTKLRVTQAGDGMTIEPDTVYLIPPGRNLTIAARTLQLTDQPPGLNMPIDIFLSSLAADVREKAIGIILSGTGSDGSKGIVDIKRYGGKVIAQDGRSAKFDGMPLQAQQTGKVDYTLPPERMGKLLERIAGGEDDSEGFADSACPPSMQDLDEDEGDREVKELVLLMQRETSIDFSFYKTASLMRRVERRMGLVGAGTIGEYIEHVRKHPGELKQLKRDLLIHVTNFFRDPDAFARLEELVLPQLIHAERSGEVRVWVPGCATGEEAYSIAILIMEYMQRNELQMKVRLRIFATDIDKESVEYAVQGLYPESIAGSVSAERLQRYFVRSGDAYRVSDPIRRTVVFLPHNVTKDAPFHHIDLVSCRNTLIYLQPDMQMKVLEQFQFALNPQGFLFLGPSETLGKLASQFHVLDQRWNMFRLREPEAVATPTPFWNGERGVPQLTRRTKMKGSAPEGGFRPDGLQAVLLDEHMTPSLVVDENLDIVHMSGGMGRFMRWSSGKPAWNLRKLFDPRLAVALSTAVQKVRRDQKPASFIGFETDQGVPFELTVKPFSTKQPQYAGLIMLGFLESRQRPPFEEPASMDPALRQRISLLEQQLQHAEDALRATIEELETSNEELQATNEELIASNEELQSTNEELQTVNEELVTVNSEYQYKIEELTELNNDMENFLASTKIGTIFLDTEMCVRRFTPAVTKEINLLEVDYGRPISHISHSFKYDALVRDASRVLQTMEPLEREIQSRGGRWYSMRLLPYRTLEDEVRGIVITFVDITELKNMNEELVKLSYAVDQSPARVVMSSMDGKINYVNRKFSEKTGRRFEDVIGLNLREIGKWKPDEFKSMVAAIKEGRSWEGELEGRTIAGEAFREWVRLLPVTNPKGQIVHMLWQAEDVPERVAR